MKKWLQIVIVVGIILVLMIGAFFLFRSNHNKNIENSQSNLNVYAINEKNEKIRTGFEVKRGSYMEYKDKTIIKGVIKATVSANNTMRVQNYNLEDQNYYTYITEDIKTKPNESRRVILRPKEPGEISVSYEGKISRNDDIVLNLEAEDLVKNVGFCVSWTDSLVYVKPFNNSYSVFENPKRFEDYVDCFEIGDMKDEVKNIKLETKIWSDLKPSDKIELIVFDGDKKISGVDYGEEDNWAKDEKYVINEIG